jgi:hypothetical protein
MQVQGKRNDEVPFYQPIEPSSQQAARHWIRAGINGFGPEIIGTSLAVSMGRSIVARRKVQVNRFRTATVIALLASFVSFQPVFAMDQGRSRRDRWEQREEQRERREARREHREDVREARRDYWDASRYYRQDDRRYRPRRLSRNDWVYRGSTTATTAAATMARRA